MSDLYAGLAAGVAALASKYEAMWQRSNLRITPNQVAKELRSLLSAALRQPAPEQGLLEQTRSLCEMVIKWLDAPMGYRAVTLEDCHEAARELLATLARLPERSGPVVPETPGKEGQ